MSVLDDDQIESLMMETGEYVTFLAQHSDFTNHGHGGADVKALPLPAKLSYLQVPSPLRLRPRPHRARCSAAQCEKWKILNYLHSDALCVNTLTDNSGFHDVKLCHVLHSVLLSRSVRTRGERSHSSRGLGRAASAEQSGQ